MECRSLQFQLAACGVADERFINTPQKLLPFTDRTPLDDSDSNTVTLQLGWGFLRRPLGRIITVYILRLPQLVPDPYGVEV